MNFVYDIEKTKYDSFVQSNKNKSHFLQSYAWGEFQEKTQGKKAHYLGVEDKSGKLLCAALLLETKLYLGYKYFYSPRGFVIDFFNKELLEFFTNEINTYIKKRKGIFLKIDPDLIIKKENYKDEELKLDYNWEKAFTILKDLGYKHLGFSKNFETAQPRYSFRIDLKQSEEDIIDHFAKSTKQRIKKSERFNIEIEIGKTKDLKEFYRLMRDTEMRKDFVSHDYDYYKNLFDIYNKDNEIKLFLAYLYPQKVIDSHQKRLDDLLKDKKKLDEKGKYNQNRYNELLTQIDISNRYIKEYSDAKDKHGDKILVNAHVNIFYGNKAWSLYAANMDELNSAGTNYELYKYHILYSKEKGYDIYDHFGTVDKDSEDKSLIGLYIMKKSFGGDYIEFIGEFDLITNKFMYFVFNRLIGAYRSIKKRLLKRKLKQ